MVSLPQASSASASLQGKVEELMATPPTRKNQHFAISAAMQDPKTAGEQLDALTPLAYSNYRVYEHWNHGYSKLAHIRSCFLYIKLKHGKQDFGHVGPGLCGHFRSNHDMVSMASGSRSRSPVRLAGTGGSLVKWQLFVSLCFFFLWWWWLAFPISCFLNPLQVEWMWAMMMVQAILLPLECHL